MFKTIRKLVSSWVLTLLLGLVIISFAISGAGTDLIGGANNPIIAVVGDEKIDQQEFYNLYNRIVRMQQQEDSSLTNSELAKQGLDTQVLDNLINEASLRDFFKKEKIVASPRLVSKKIKEIPAFQTLGNFDPGLYENNLRQQGIKQDDFEKDVATQVMQEQLAKVVLYKTEIPLTVVNAYIKPLREKRIALISSLPIAPFAKKVKKPDDKILNTYYNKTIKAWTLPEFRQIRYAILDRNVALKLVTVQEAEIKEKIAQLKADNLKTSRRHIRQVILTDKKAADSLVARIAARETFEKVAPAITGAELEDLDIGLVNEEELARDVEAEIASKVFAAKQGSLIGPEKSDLGWYIWQILKVEDAKKRSDKEYREEAITSLKNDRAIDLLYELSHKVEDALAANTEFNKVVKTFKMTVKDLPPLSRDATDEEGQVADVTDQEKSMILTMFDTDSQDPLQLRELSREVFFIGLIKKTIPTTPKPLEKVKLQVTQRYMAEKMVEAAQKAADDITTRAAKGESLNKLRRKYRFTPQRQFEITRMQLIEAQRQNQPPPPIIAQMFTIREGEATSALSPIYPAIDLLVLKKVIPGAKKKYDPLLADLKRSFKNANDNEVGEAFIHSIRDMSNPEIKRDHVKAIHAQLVKQGQ